MSNKTTKDARYNVRLSCDLLERMKRAARDAGLSVSELVRKGIELAIAEVRK